MTELSTAIFKDWQVRKTKKQKDDFIAFLRAQLPELQIEEGGLFRSRNLILGDIDSAKVVFSAHYDTCATLPFPNFLTPKNIPLYILYNLLICLVIFLAAGLLSYLVVSLTHRIWAAQLACLLLCALVFWLLLGGKPNPVTANDNTSGVIALCEIYAALSEEERKKAAFVFFDNEELGLLGSRFFLKRHKQNMQEKLLVNLDCISDGDYLLLIENKRARSEFGAALRAACEEAALPAGQEVRWEKSSTTLYPSDQMDFPCYVAVAAFHRGSHVGLYLSRIHTKRDTVFEEENLRFFIEAGQNLTRRL